MVEDVEMQDQAQEEAQAPKIEPMEVTSDGQTTDDPLKGSYIWSLENFPEQENKIFSPQFELGGYSWHLLCFPRGNNREGMFSLYLAVPDSDDQLEGWERTANFKLSVLNQQHPERTITKDAHHSFHEGANDWGFTAFCNLQDLNSPESGFIVDDALKIKVEVAVTSTDEDAQYYTREETGFVGLRNQGATCYMNSLLQTLYNVNAFRKALYHMPTSEDEEASSSLSLALQSVFYKLQFTPGPVSTLDLTASFGWDTADAFQQHDVQELNRILCDRLEEKMKGTRVEGTINRLFEGHTLNYIDCINIDYKSSRKEAFQDLQLDVKGCGTIYDSFDKYCEVETLEGDNKYEAEGHGKQDARKGVLFENLPPVLNLHLKRFEYDYQKDAMVKINDRYEFYDDLDLDKLNKDGTAPAYLSSGHDKSVENKYKLLAVLVHSGGVHGGHYYAYIRPDGKEWLKFDDEAVSLAADTKAVQDNWGGDIDDNKGSLTYPASVPLRFSSKISNAYMLVYVRQSEWDSVMCEVTEEDISEHVRARLKAEEEEKAREKKERAEAHLYILVRIATDADFKKQIGHSTFFELVDFDHVELQLKLSKKATFAEVEQEVAKRLGVPPEKQRYWKWLKRQNETFRPNETLPSDVSSMTFISIIKELNRRQPRQGEIFKLDLFLETPNAKDSQFQPVQKGSALLFFKHYLPGDASNPPKLEYAGRAVLPTSQLTFEKIEPLLKIRAGLPEDTKIVVYEEVKFDPSVIVEEVRRDMTLVNAKVEHGDILIVQRMLTEEERAATEFPGADDFMKHVRDRVAVTFRKLEGPTVVEDEESTLQLQLLKSMTWDQVSEALAHRLGLDHPLKVRFTQQSAYTPLPRPQPLKYNPALTLEDLIKTYHGQAPVLYYEPIDLPLPEYERLVTFRVAFHNAKHEESTAVAVRVLKDHTVGEMLEEVRAQLPAEAHNGKPLRLLEVYQWRIWHVFDPSLPVERNLTASGTAAPWHLRAEVIPDDQVDLEEPEKLHVHCLQVEDKDNNPKNPFPFGDPFIMSLGPTETVGELKARVQAEMSIPDEEFASWKVVLIAGMSNSQEPLGDEVVIAERLHREDLSSKKLWGHHDRQMLGFHHENRNPRRTHAHINRPSAVAAQERALKIRA